MKHDKAVVASILGAVSTLAGEAVSRILIISGIGLHSIYSFDSIIITINRFSFVYGFLVNIIAGGIVAVLLYYALKRLSSECIIYKAVAFSTIAWFGVESFAIAFFEGKFIDIRPLDDYAVHFIGAAANGVMLGLLFKWVLFKKQENRKDK